MFVSFKIIDWLSSEPKSPDFWRCQYTLVDDEFGEVSGATASCAEVGGAVGVGAIILEYGKRKLNVEGNLLKYLMKLCSENDVKLTWLLAQYDQNYLDPQYAQFAALWKTVDQQRLLKLATFA